MNTWCLKRDQNQVELMAAHHERTKLLTVNVISCVFHHTLAHTQFPKNKKQRSEKKMISMFLKISNPSEKLDEKTKEKTLSWEAVKHAPPATCSREFSPCSWSAFPWKEGHSPFHQLASLLAEMRTQALGGNPPRRWCIRKTSLGGSGQQGPQERV